MVMRRLVKKIAISAAIAASAALAASASALAASHVQPEVGVAIATPTDNKVYYNSPVNLIIVRSPKWDKLKADNGGQIPISSGNTQG